MQIEYWIQQPFSFLLPSKNISSIFPTEVPNKGWESVSFVYAVHSLKVWNHLCPFIIYIFIFSYFVLCICFVFALYLLCICIVFALYNSFILRKTLKKKRIGKKGQLVTLWFPYKHTLLTIRTKKTNHMFQKSIVLLNPSITLALPTLLLLLLLSFIFFFAFCFLKLERKQKCNNKLQTSLKHYGQA